jgi:hypothetical protein
VLCFLAGADSIGASVRDQRHAVHGSCCGGLRGVHQAVDEDWGGGHI